VIVTEGYMYVLGGQGSVSRRLSPADPPWRPGVARQNATFCCVQLAGFAVKTPIAKGCLP
jgi:hypothetical protein